MPDINWRQFLELEYWFAGIVGDFSVTPSIQDTSSFEYLFFPYLFLSIFSFGVLLRVSQSFIHENHPFQRKFALWGNNLIGIAICGICWFLFMQISVGFLGARFWFLVLAIWFLVILGFAMKYFLRNYKFEILYFKKTKKPLPNLQ